MQIDAHQHYWDPARGDYGWLTPDLDILYRTFGPADLKPLRERAGIERTVLVQAAPTIEETHYLLGLARDEPSIAGVVGWVPLLSPTAPDLIEALAREPKFKGVRPMLQDLPDDTWIANPELTPAIEALIARDLAFDALIYARHVEHLLKSFGPARLMWGSDWPVLELNGDYLLWHSVSATLLASLSDDEREAVFGGNAAAFYRI